MRAYHQLFAEEGGLEVFHPVLPSHPHAAYADEIGVGPSVLRGVRRRRGLHPAEVLAVVHVSEPIDGVVRNADGVGKNSLRHSPWIIHFLDPFRLFPIDAKL